MDVTSRCDGHACQSAISLGVIVGELTPSLMFVGLLELSISAMFVGQNTWLVTVENRILN